MILKQQELYDLSDHHWPAPKPSKGLNQLKGKGVENWLTEITGGESPDPHTHWDALWRLEEFTVFVEVKTTSKSYISISPEEIDHCETWLKRGVDTIIFACILMHPRSQFKFIGSVLYSSVKDFVLQSKIQGWDPILYLDKITKHHIDVDLPIGQPIAPLVLQYPIS